MKIAAFFFLMAALLFLMSYLGHRYQSRLDRLLSQWWSPPLAILGCAVIAVAICGLAVSVS
jgi:uncharacterized protein YggT (Ycf19 family)